VIELKVSLVPNDDAPSRSRTEKVYAERGPDDGSLSLLLGKSTGTASAFYVACSATEGCIAAVYQLT
jgi:hypothetical protein